MSVRTACRHGSENAKPNFFVPLSSHCNSVSATRKDNRDTVVSGRTFTESGGETDRDRESTMKTVSPVRVRPSPSNVDFPNKRPSAWPKAARAHSLTRRRTQSPPPSLPPSLPPGFSPFSQRPADRPRPRAPTFLTLECRCPLVASASSLLSSFQRIK